MRRPSQKQPGVHVHVPSVLVYLAWDGMSNKAPDCVAAPVRGGLRGRGGAVGGGEDRERAVGDDWIA